jgi:tellurite resistance protein
LPIGLFGAVMGLAGLGLSARAAAPVLPGLIQAPAYFTEPWVLAGLLAFVFLSAAYLVKLFRDPAEVRLEFTNTATIGFCGALPVGMGLAAGGLAPYAPGFAGAMWWAAFGLLLAFQLWALARWLGGQVELAHLNGGWLIVMVGGIVLPGPGVALGHIEAARFCFGFSASIAPVLVALLFYRAATEPRLPDALRPTWFILLVPPSLIYANGMLLYPDAQYLEVLFPFDLMLCGGLLYAARGFARWPFGAPWWAFTFPLDALAYASARFALDHPAPQWRWVCGATLLLAMAAVLLVLWRTLRSAASRPA